VRLITGRQSVNWAHKNSKLPGLGHLLPIGGWVASSNCVNEFWPGMRVNTIRLSDLTPLDLTTDRLLRSFLCYADYHGRLHIWGGGKSKTSVAFISFRRFCCCCVSVLLIFLFTKAYVSK